VYYLSLPALFAPVAIVGLWRNGKRDVSLMLSAGLVTVLFFFLVGMFFNVYTRYMLFGAPFFALGAGYVLDGLAERGAPGRILAFGAVAAIGLAGLTYWAARVVS
jgi:hypothetical protein